MPRLPRPPHRRARCPAASLTVFGKIVDCGAALPGSGSGVSSRVSHFPAWRPILMKRLLLVIFSVWNIKTFSGAVSVRQTSNCNISHAKLHPNYHHCGLSSNISNTLLWRGRISRIDQIKQNTINKWRWYWSTAPWYYLFFSPVDRTQLFILEEMTWHTCIY